MPLTDILLLEQMPHGMVAVYDKDPDVPLYYWDQGEVHKQADERRHVAKFQTDADAEASICALLQAVVKDQNGISAFAHPYAFIRHPDTPNPVTHMRDFVHPHMPRELIYLVQEPELLGRRVLSVLGHWAYFIFNPDGVRAIDLDAALVYAVLEA
jgi:hypothetical protein